MENLVVGVVTYVFGLLSGYILHDFIKKTLMMDDNNSKNLLLLAVTVIWGVSMLVSIFNPTYQVPVPVHGIMGAIVGFFFYRGKDGAK